MELTFYCRRQKETRRQNRQASRREIRWGELNMEELKKMGGDLTTSILLSQRKELDLVLLAMRSH